MTHKDYQLAFDPEHVEMGDILDLEELSNATGLASIRGLMHILARYVQDETGEYVGQDAGFKALRAYQPKEIVAASKTFMSLLEQEFKDDSPKAEK